MHTLISKDWHSKLYQQIEAADQITIFRHVNPDGDAYGSSLGLLYWIRETFPEKKVFLSADDEGTLINFFEPHDEVSDEFIKDSLAIILDTANSLRVSDQRYQLAKYIIKVDHHPFTDRYGQDEYIEDTLSSSCEIVAEFIYHYQRSALSQKIARYLYAGMLTDTVSFSISSVKSNTLKLAGWLLESGIDVSIIHEELFSQEANIFDYVTFLRENATVCENGLIYCYVKNDILTKYNVDFNQAKEFVNVYKSRKDAQIWVLLVEAQDKSYNLSLRSKKVAVNDIAKKFGGGGHVLASATKNLTYQQTQELLNACHQKLNRTQ